MASKRKFYRTVIEYEVFSEEPIDDHASLADIAHECDHGDWSGQYIRVESKQVNGPEVAKGLQGQGSDPGFFQLDDEGNDIEE